MDDPIQPIRDFVIHIEKTLTRRKLYASNTAPFRQAAENLFESLQAATGDEGLTIRLTSTDLFLGKTSILHRDKGEEAYFFPLFRDGLRELTFSPGTTLEETVLLLDTLEAEGKGLISPSQDTISFLWRCDLQGITFKAIDGIGDEEGEDQTDSVNDDYQALVADVMSKIQNPAAPETGQKYSFRVDADTKVAATDLHYESTTTRRTFEENPTVLQLTPEEVSKLREGIEKDTEDELLKRFIEILFVMLTDPGGTVSGSALLPVFKQFLEGYWKGQDYAGATYLLTRIHEISETAPLPETREAVKKILVEFLTAERFEEILELVRSSTLPMDKAALLWKLAGDDFWNTLIDFCSTLPEGELRVSVNAWLQDQVSLNRNLLKSTLTSSDSEQIRIGLALLDEGLYETYQNELLALGNHPDESIRIKGVAAAGRIGGKAALDVLWKVMQKDPSKSVRLLAFRLMANLDYPQLPQRLKTLISDPEFASRPLWEREKYVKLLGRVGGISTHSLFEAWIPQKQWFWQKKDHEQAVLALHGIAATGEVGRNKVRALAQEGGKVGPIAKAVLSTARTGDKG